MWLQQNALKFLEAGIAQTLLSTSPIFIAVFHVLSGKKVKLQTIIGIFLSLIGVFMLFLLG
jgi:drug/metabolite transporter (DMT)-like permease